MGGGGDLSRPLASGAVMSKMEHHVFIPRIDVGSETVAVEGMNSGQSFHQCAECG